MRREKQSGKVFSVSMRVRLNILGLDRRDPGLARGVERRIAPLKFRKLSARVSTETVESPECARADQQSESLNRKLNRGPARTRPARNENGRLESKANRMRGIAKSRPVLDSGGLMRLRECSRSLPRRFPKALVWFKQAAMSDEINLA